ncbi:MAG: formyltransferase family protein, partial [Rhodospirillaceae bacterium]
GLDADTAAKVRVVGRVNEPGVIEAVRELAPDLGISYGIGRAKPALFTLPAWGTINVHRGIAQDYRGLDSEYWAILEGRFDKLGVTIHYVDAELD